MTANPLRLTAALGLLVALPLACVPPPPPRKPPPRDEEELRPREVVEAELLRDAMDHFDRGKVFSAEHSVDRIIGSSPDHLEARILLAMIYAAEGEPRLAAEAWMRVERILVFRGKQRSFELQPTLHASVVHYMKNGRRDRSRLFLDELWRRFPTSEWSIRAQLVVAEAELAERQFARVEEACRELERMLPDKKHAALARCHELEHVARRMGEMGPEPSDASPTWIWEHPLPQGNALNDLWAGPKGDLFAVGESGTILVRRAGARVFSLVAPLTRLSLRAVSGTDDKNVYAAGVMGIIVHFDGKEWRVVRQPSPRASDLWAIHAAAPAEVVAVGEGGTVVELRDGAFHEERPVQASLRGVTSTGQGRVYAVGAGGLLLARRDGHWSSLASDSYEDLFAIWGADDEHLFAVGNRKTVVFFDGQKAKESVVGPSHFRDVWGIGHKEAYAVGTSGAIARFSGKDWKTEPSGTLVDLRGVSGSSPKEVYAVGVGGTVVERRAGRWALVSGGLAQDLVGVSAGPSLGEGYALGERGFVLKRSKQGRWSTENLPVPGRYKDLFSDGKRLVAVGEHGLMTIRDKKTWRLQTTDTPEDLLSVSGAEGTIVAVGTRATIIRIEGAAAIQDRPAVGLDLMAVQMFSRRSAVAVGRRGTVLRFDGKAWNEVDSTVLADLHGVWGVSDVDFYAVGAGGTILRFSGGRMAQMHSPSSQNLIDVWGSSAESVFAVSAEGGILRYDSGQWRIENSPSSCLRAIRGDPATGVLAVGCSGAILRWQPKSL
jgi:hypothetical protein